MKPLSEQDHYEILEIASDASRAEIERAFRMAQSTYADDSLAGYSVFGDGDANAMRERIEIAYRVLSDPETRSAYDAVLVGGPQPVSLAAPPPQPAEQPELLEAVAPAPAKPVEAPPRIPIDAIDALEDESGEFDGGRLRRSRLHRGMELEDISGVTKISPSYLRFIEEDRYAELPAPVYVRGFVKAYAECMGLDAKRVASSYMKKFEAETGASRRMRFRGGR